MTADIRAESAEDTIPSGMRTVLQILREEGHSVRVRRSARNGSWYYSVDGQKEVRGGPLCTKYRHYGI